MFSMGDFWYIWTLTYGSTGLKSLEVSKVRRTATCTCCQRLVTPCSFRVVSGSGSATLTTGCDNKHSVRPSTASVVISKRHAVSQTSRHINTCSMCIRDAPSTCARSATIPAERPRRLAPAVLETEEYKRRLIATSRCVGITENNRRLKRALESLHFQPRGERTYQSHDRASGEAARRRRPVRPRNFTRLAPTFSPVALDIASSGFHSTTTSQYTSLVHCFVHLAAVAYFPRLR